MLKFIICVCMCVCVCAGYSILPDNVWVLEVGREYEITVHVFDKFNHAILVTEVSFAKFTKYTPLKNNPLYSTCTRLYQILSLERCDEDGSSDISPHAYLLLHQRLLPRGEGREEREGGHPLQPHLGDGERGPGGLEGRRQGEEREEREERGEDFGRMMMIGGGIKGLEEVGDEKEWKVMICFLSLFFSLPPSLPPFLSLSLSFSLIHSHYSTRLQKDITN